jgi:uncharacterized protein
MSVDLTPLIPAGRQIIDSYGDGRFTVSGTVHHGSIIVFTDRTLDWPVNAIAEVTLGSLQPIFAVRESLEVVLIGCGARLTQIPRELRQVLRQSGLAAELMDTGAACRTYNVLAAEERKVVAALIAVH